MGYLDEIENLFKKRIYNTKIRIVREATELIVEIEETTKFIFKDTKDFIAVSIVTQKFLNPTILINSVNEKIEYHNVVKLIDKYDSYMSDFIGNEINDLSYYSSTLKDLSVW